MKAFRQRHLSLSIKTPESVLHPAASRAQNFITTNYTQRLIKHAMANISTAYIRYIEFSITCYPMDSGLLITFTGKLFIYQYMYRISHICANKYMPNYLSIYLYSPSEIFLIC